jgi:tRNA-binding EMAP/Myf-like protein
MKKIDEQNLLYFQNKKMKPIITFEEFSKIDIRIGTILEVEDFPKALKPAYQLTIV